MRGQVRADLLATLCKRQKIVYHQGTIVHPIQSAYRPVVVLTQPGETSLGMLLFEDKFALLKPNKSGYNLMKNAHARRCAPGGQGVLPVQNRAEWKQLVAGAAHLCKERVPEYLD
jgi:hypothetical protein